MDAEQFLGLADLLPELMLLVSVDGTIAAANRAFAERMGVPRPALRGQRLADLTDTPPAAVLDHLRLCAGSRQLLMGALVLRPVGGDPLPCRMEGALFAPANGARPALVALRLRPRDSAAARFIALNLEVDQLTSEVARRVRSEEALREQREIAEAANRAKDQFLAMLSHELRTPLNAIMGWAHVLGLEGFDEAQRRRAVDIIARNAELQAVLIDDLLDVSRIITGKLRIREDKVQMRTVTEAALDAVRPAAGNRQVALHADLPAVRELLGDPERLQQVAWNLLSNAVKFTPPGGRVDVRLADAGPVVQLTVTDTGEGFTPAFQPFLFDAFRQGDASFGRRSGGLGLGLTIVRHLVEAHGGTVQARSSGPGTGAEFTVRLPVRPGPAAPGMTPG